MNKSDAAHFVKSRLPEWLASGNQLHFANVNAAKPVWWLDLPFDAVERNGSGKIKSMITMLQTHGIEYDKRYRCD